MIRLRLITAYKELLNTLKLNKKGNQLASLSSVTRRGKYSDFLFYKKLSLLPHAKVSLTTHPRKLRTTLNRQMKEGYYSPPRCLSKDSYKNTIEVQSQGTYFLLRFSNRKKWSFCNKSGSKACSINKNVGEVRHTSSTARQGLSDPAAGISTLTDKCPTISY